MNRDCQNCGSRQSVDEDGYCNAGCQTPQEKQAYARYLRDILRPQRSDEPTDDDRVIPEGK